MKLTDYIKKYIPKRYSVLNSVFGFYCDPFEARQNFANAIWLNICEILIDLCNDVTFSYKGKDDIFRFSKFKVFFERYGKFVMQKLFDEGYVVIAENEQRFFVLKNGQYSTRTLPNGDVDIRANDIELQTYVMQSNTYFLKNESDKQVCRPFLQFLDNVLNASNTVSSRLGALVVGSPAQSSNLPTQTVFTKEQKEELEKTMSKEYGSLSGQKQFMLLPRSMNFQTINLSSIDQKTSEKARLAILAICDRIKVPANQVAIIDASSSKSLANGTELREGDFNKYQSFERLLNQTFVQMAKDLNIRVDYTIYNKPLRQKLI